MGFYGNITNTSRTQFQFDRTFPNRTVMDQFIGTDGVYIGRFVLVEYDKALAADWCVTAYMKTDANKVRRFYTRKDASAPSEIGYGNDNIAPGKYIRVPGSFKDVDGTWISYNLDDESVTEDYLYLIKPQTGDTTPINTDLVSYKGVAENDYIINYNLDRQTYGGGRGYDSTVWQKVYADGKETYVMIAELNSVVPTFDVSADAPTMSPVAPHFDVDSTNIYYRVHWQPAWGLRVKAAAPTVYVKPTLNNGATVPGENVILSDELNKAIPSDETTIWKRSAYDTMTGDLKNYYYDPSVDKNTSKMYGEWIESKEVPSRAKFPAAIYYNKAGFDPTTITYSDNKILDKIAIEPTGLSGYSYNQHNGLPSEAQVDTQELTILLPSIGNSVAKMWDMIYGDKNINKSDKRNLIIDWTQGSIVPNVSGLRLVTRTSKGYGFETKNASTLAGAINSVHDLMGMIIKDNSALTAQSTGSAVQSLNDDYIYYLTKEARYFRKHKKYEYNEVDSFNKDDCFSKVSFDTANWPTPHSNYYLDFLDANPKDTNDTPYPNIILERNVWHEDDRQYYTTASLRRDIGEGPYTTEDFDGVFKPRTFFVQVEKKVTLNRGEVTTQAFQISLDETYQNTSTYHIISHTPLGDNTRFWIEGEYLIGNFSIYENHSQEDFDNRILFEKITVNKKTRYIRPTTYDSTATYYSATFTTDSGNYDSNKQYFTADIKEENNKTYIERVSYIPVAEGEVNAENFYYRSYYITTDRIKYQLASQFESGVQYYTKKVTLELVEGNTTISAGNVNEIDVILFQENQGYCKYIPEGAGGANGFEEYIVLSNPLIPTYANSDNLVKIDLKTITNIYKPNLYYYEITDDNDPLKGSIVFDSNTNPTEGREYFSRYAATYSGLLSYSVGTKVYKPFTYYYKNGSDYILETSEQPTAGREYYIKDKGIYVISDSSGRYPKGLEWNLNISKIPDTVTIGRRTETWGLEELYGFARHFSTIHGLILRLTKALETNNSLIRDYDTVQGVINRIKDLLVQFGEMYANQIMVTDAYGRIISVPLTDDDTWIEATYGNGSNFNIKHLYTGTESTKAKTLTVSGESSSKTIPFAGKFTSPSFSLRTDAMGHANEFSTSSVTITMPTLSLTPDTSGNVVTGITMEFNEAKTLATFKEAKENVGNLTLADYTTPAENVTGITASDSIISAFTKINTLLAGYDTSTTAAVNNYITSVTQTNGKVTATTAATTTITQLGIITVGTWDSTIAANRVTTNSIINGAVTDAKVASGIDASKLTTGTLPADRIAASSIASGKIISLDASKLTGTLSMDRIAKEAISNDKLASGINGAKISDNTIADAKISGISAGKVSGTLATGNIPGLSSNKITSLGDYAKGNSTSPIDKDDSLNTALGKLEHQLNQLESRVSSLSNRVSQLAGQA